MSCRPWSPRFCRLVRRVRQCTSASLRAARGGGTTLEPMRRRYAPWSRPAVTPSAGTSSRQHNPAVIETRPCVLSSAAELTRTRQLPALNGMQLKETTSGNSAESGDFLQRPGRSFGLQRLHAQFATGLRCGVCSEYGAAGIHASQRTAPCTTTKAGRVAARSRITGGAGNRPTQVPLAFPLIRQ